MKETAKGTLYRVEAGPDEGPPFDGPAERDWDQFRLEDGGACFEWRTPGEWARLLAARVERGEVALGEALADPRTKDWLARVANEASFIAEDEGIDLSAMDEQEANAWILRECAHLDGYLEDDDAPLLDAACCLDLPPWAKVTSWPDGGPGSGFTAAGIRIAKGKSLAELKEWLDANPG